MWKNGKHFLAQFLQAQVSQTWQIDIHPNATVGEGIMLDHGTGTVHPLALQHGRLLLRIACFMSHFILFCYDCYSSTTTGIVVGETAMVGLCVVSIFSSFGIGAVLR